MTREPDAVYKIMDLTTGLFSTGGIVPRWTTRGKSWTTEGAVKAHLTLLKGSKNAALRYAGRSTSEKYDIPDDWIVVRYTYTPDESQMARALAERPAKK